jgi:fumarylacetoacetase
LNPTLRSWVAVPAHSDFTIHNLPFGIFQTPELSPRIGVAIGEQVADLVVLAEHGFFDDLQIDAAVFQQRYLNDFIALGKAKTRAVRDRLSQILDNDLEEWDASQLAPFFLRRQSDIQMLLPVKVGDYTDFYSSLEHASNVGSMFRDPANPLLPNWRHLPVAYHGRASSVVVSGTTIRRPNGQILPPGSQQPVFKPTQELDFELEVAFIIGKPTALGQTISVNEAEDYIFGMVLFNDWSARDIQRWEYQPLGPFLSKNFASTMSPWVVTLDALEPFRTDLPMQEPAVLPYLQSDGLKSFDIHLEVAIQAENQVAQPICRSNFKNLYWNMSQQLAHHTVNGCNVNVGDVLASGTISGSTPDSYGSLLELTWRGTKPIQLPDGSERTFLQDGDTVTLRGWCERDGLRIGFGEAVGKVVAGL